MSVGLFQSHPESLVCNIKIARQTHKKKNIYVNYRAQRTLLLIPVDRIKFYNKVISSTKMALAKHKRICIFTSF